MNKIKVMIVDDMEDIRDYFKMIIDKEPSMEIVATESTGKDAVITACKVHPDIILMDVQMETNKAGIEAAEELKHLLPSAKIIILTIHEDDDLLFEAYAAGVIDYVVKTASIIDIINAIHNAYKNIFTMRPEIAEKIVGEFARMKSERSSLIYTINIMTMLTKSEFEILHDVYNGKTYREIAQSRFVEEVTVRSQINRILKKFKSHQMKDVVKQLKQLKIFEVYGGLL